MDSATEPPGKPRFHLVFNLFLETKAGERTSGGLGGTTEEDRGRGRAGWASSFLIWGEGRGVSRGQAGGVA